MRSSTLIATLYALAPLLLVPLTWAQPVPCEGGVAGDYACENVDLLAHLPLSSTPNTNESSSDIWGWTDPVTGVEYAIINQYDHTAFVDLSDPTAPVVIGTLPAPAERTQRDAKVYADHAFITTDNPPAPVQVFDLTRLRDVEDPPATFTEDALYTVGTDPHNLAIDEASGFAYLLGLVGGVCDAGLHIVDVREPQNPTYAGCLNAASGGGRYHDAQCVTYDGPDADYTDREVCFGSTTGGGTLAIADVTDKQAPLLITETPYPNAAHAHQGWLTEDRRYFLLNDEFDESVVGFPTRTVVFDVSDLDNPEFAFEHFAETASTDHNLFVRGRYVYQANYTSGLRILDLAQIDEGVLTELASFDTCPQYDDVRLDCAFGVYPYFESGVVVVSDMASGLFVLRPHLDPATDVEGVAQASEIGLEVYPNPTLGRAQVAFSLGSPQDVRIALHDVLGREVAVLAEGTFSTGRHEAALEASRLAPGFYVVRLDAHGEVASRRLTVIH